MSTGKILKNEVGKITKKSLVVKGIGKKRRKTTRKAHKSKNEFDKKITKKIEQQINWINSKDNTKNALNIFENRKFEDPFEIQMPPQWLGAKTCNKIMRLKKVQYALWGWTVALAIILLLIVTAFELLIDFGVMTSINHAYHEILQTADIVAIMIIGLELVQGYRHAKNKILYLKNNWIMILAVLPIGAIVRLGRAFEGLVILEEIASLRTLQVMTKFRELSWILPSLELPYEMTIAFERLFFRIGSLTRAVSTVGIATTRIVAQWGDVIIIFLSRIFRF